MRLSWRRLSCAAVLLLPAAACGKKGPPLAPLLRVPAQVAELSAQRSADAVYLTALVPSTNVGGDAPGDVGGLEVYAATAEREPPLGEGDPGPPWELVQRLRVRRPVPPPPPAKAGAPAVPPLPLEPGVDQGQRVTLREALTAAHLEPSDVPVPAAPAAAGRPTSSNDRPSLLPVVAPIVDRSARRFYVARALTRGGRPGKWSTIRAVPTATLLGAPVAALPTYNATTLALSWTPPPGARTAPAPPGDGLLASRPFGPAPVTTRYNVYLDAPESAADALGLVTRAAPLNRAPIRRALRRRPGRDLRSGALLRRPQPRRDGRRRRSRARPRRRSCVTPRDTLPAAGADGARGRRRRRGDQPDLGSGRGARPGGLPGLQGRSRRRADDAADAGADPRHQLRGPHGHAGRALRLRGRRDRLGHARQSERAVESGGRDGATVGGGSGSGTRGSGRTRGAMDRIYRVRQGSGRALRGRARQRALLARGRRVRRLPRRRRHRRAAAATSWRRSCRRRSWPSASTTRTTPPR